MRAQLHHTVLDDNGLPVTGALISVDSIDTGALAPAYAARTGPTGVTQPMSTVHGRVDAFFDPGSYTCNVNGAPIGLESYTFEWESLPADSVLYGFAPIQVNNYAALSGEFVPFDISGASRTLTLPLTPTDKTRTGALVINTTGSNTVTVVAQGTDVFSSGAQTYVLSTLGWSAVFVYSAADAMWFVVSTGARLDQLDARYLRPANNLSELADPEASRAALRIPVLRDTKTVAIANVALLGLQLINGYQLVDGDRILATAQSTGSQNGPWIAHAGGWVRPGDYPNAGVATSRSVTISGGSYAGTDWYLATTASIVIDSSISVWRLKGRQAGTGLSLSGNALSVTYGTTSATAVQGNDSRIANAAPRPTVRTVAANTTASSYDVLLVNATAGAVTITPPTNTTTARFVVHKLDSTAHPVTISGTVDGVVNPTLNTQHQSFVLVGDGTSWYRETRSSLSTLPDYPALTDARYIQSGGLASYMVKSANLSDLTDTTVARANLGLASYLLKSSNLADLPSAPTARTNLGLGTIATAAASDYLTPAAETTLRRAGDKTRVVHVATTDGETSPPQSAGVVVGLVPVSIIADGAEGWSLVGVISRAIVGPSGTASVYKVQFDHGSGTGTLSDVTGLTSVTPATGRAVRQAATGSPVALSDLDTVALVLVTPGTTKGIALAIEFERTHT